MAKIKKISVNAFEKIVKENYETAIVREWRGLEVTITPTISLKDVMGLVAEVADNCFMEDGRFMPEVMQPLLDCGVVERYTNISLPSNLESRYELVARSNILDFLMAHINTNQYNDIVMAIRDRVEYMCDVNTSEFNHAMTQMMQSLEDIQESTKNLFSGMTETDLKALVSAVSGERAIEEKIVGEYIKQKNAPLKIVGEDNGD